MGKASVTPKVGQANGCGSRRGGAGRTILFRSASRRDCRALAVQGIPPEPGWYIIETNTPIAVLQSQHREVLRYNKAKCGSEVSVKNADIAALALRHTPATARYFAEKIVYSGFHQNLGSRARQHTFGDHGTGALLLSLYEPLQPYEWKFGYLTLEGYLGAQDEFSRPDRAAQLMLLNLGEQLLRGLFGWPLLCSR